MITIPALSSVNNILDTDLVMITHSTGDSYKMSGADLKNLMSLQNVDTVAANNMHSVTSNAVAAAIANIPTASYSESSTGFNANFGTGFCFSRRFGKLCIISISIDSTTLAMAQDSIFCFIPEGFRPKQSVTSVSSYVKINGNIITTSNSFYAQPNGDVTQHVSGSLIVGSSINVLFIYEGV